MLVESWSIRKRYPTSLDLGIPIVFGVLTTDTIEQTEVRSEAKGYFAGGIYEFYAMWQNCGHDMKAFKEKKAEIAKTMCSGKKKK